MKVVETERLILRTWKEEDIAPFIRINQHPKVREYFRKILSPNETLEFMKKLTDHLQQHNFGYFAAELKRTDEFIGFIGIATLSFVAPFSANIELGWHLAYEHWGQGYAKEGAKAALAYGFEKIQDVKEIVSFTSYPNKRSRRVMEKIGMKHDVKGDFHVPTVPLDHKLSKHLLYRIQKTDYFE